MMACWNLTSRGQSDVSVEPAADGQSARTLSLLSQLPWSWISQDCLTCVHSGSIFSSLHLHLHLASGSNGNTLSSVVLCNSSERILSVHFEKCILSAQIFRWPRVFFSAQRPALKNLSEEINTQHIEEKETLWTLTLSGITFPVQQQSRTHSYNCSCNPRPD